MRDWKEELPQSFSPGQYFTFVYLPTPTPLFPSTKPIIMGECCVRESSTASMPSKQLPAAEKPTKQPCAKAPQVASIASKLGLKAPPGGTLSTLQDLGMRLKRLKKPFNKKFQIKKELYRGSIGVIKLVEHFTTSLQRIVRIVALAPDKNESRKPMSQEALLIAETEALRGVDHPQVLQWAEVLVDNKHLYAVSEPIVGSQVVDFRVVADAESADSIAEVMLQILQALNFCHSRSLQHRNLCISNVIFLQSASGNFYVKITGFGSVRGRPEENLSSITSQILFAPPEALKNEFSEKTDVWSCGVIFHLLWTKNVPFYGQSKDEFTKSQELPLNFAAPQWSSKSPELISLLRGMLEPDPSLRLSLSQCVAHPYLQQLTSNKYITTAKLNAALMNLKTFACGQKLKMIILSFIAVHVTSLEEKQPLVDIFQSLDTKNDGVLTRDELISAYSQTMPADLAALTVDRVFESIDLDNNGSIDFSEFMVAASDHRSLLTMNNLKIAYSLFDSDKSGDVTLAELKETLKCKQSEEQWEQFMKQVDEDSNGVLSFKEFVKLIKLAVTQASMRSQ